MYSSRLQGYPQFVTHDSDQATVEFSKAARRFRQKVTAGTKYYLTSRTAVLESMALSCIWALTPREVWLESDGRNYLIVLWARGQNEYVSNGQRLQPGPADGLLMVPDAESCLRSSGNQDLITIRIPTALMLSELEKLTGRPVEQPLRPTGLISTDSAFWQTVENFLDQLESPAGIFAISPKAGIEWQHDLIKLLIRSTPNNYASLLGRSPSLGAHWKRRIVDLAKEYIDSHLMDPLLLSNLPGAVGVGERALQVSFRDLCHKKVRQVVQEMRLDRMRRDLLVPDEETTVDKVRERYCLSDNRLAECYQKRHGEYPSEDLRKGRERRSFSA